MADFFDKVKGSIDKGIRTVSSKSKEFIETTKLKGEIKDVEATIQGRFNALGKKVFGMLNKGALNEDELKSDCSEITSLYKKITELESAIKQVELESLKMRHGADAVMCPKCGGANKSGDKFCNSCGSSLAAESQAGAEGKTCPACGALVKEGARFCAKCGGKID